MDYQSKDMETKLAHQLVRKVRNDQVKENVEFWLSIVVLLLVAFTMLQGNKLVASMFEGSNSSDMAVLSELETCALSINPNTKGLEFYDNN